MEPSSIKWNSRLFIICIFCLGKAFCLKFTLLHTNDMHSWFDPISATGEKCKPGDDEMGLCFGGFGRVATAVQEARAKGPTIYLNAGDTFQGTPWFTVYRGKMVATLLNMLAPDAMALGVHEFDDGIEKLVEFLNLVKFPVVSSTLNLTREPKLLACPKLLEYTILNVGDKKIGIVGYIRSDTRERTQPNHVIYRQEIPAINQMTQRLLKQKVNIIIALGHSGYEKDMEIATLCPDVDIVVGGQSHTFLYTGKAPHKENPEGPYPTIVMKPDGRKVLVLQAYAYTKYIGNIFVEFDDLGNLLTFKGHPMLLDQSVVAQIEVKAYLDNNRQGIEIMEKNVVGTTMVYLNGDRDSCGLGECNFGNIIADSFVYARVLQTMNDRTSWTDASIGIINAGGIRASLEPGPITEADVMMVLPFSHDLFYTRIRGYQLMKALEHSAYLRTTDNNGGFLQLSGLRVKYNFSHPKGNRIIEIEALCSSCRIPHFERLVAENSYGLVVTSFLLFGGEGYSFIDSRSPKLANMNIIDRTAMVQYLKDHKVIFPERENRILTYEKSQRSSCGRLDLTLILLAPFLYFGYFGARR